MTMNLYLEAAVSRSLDSTLAISLGALAIFLSTFFWKGRYISDDLDLYRKWRRSHEILCKKGKKPTMSMDEFKERSELRLLVVIEDFVFDLTNFDHPGGASVLKELRGLDATPWFVATHARSRRALSSLVALQVGRLEDDHEPLVDLVDRRWKQIFEQAITDRLFNYQASWLARDISEFIMLLGFGLWLGRSNWLCLPILAAAGFRFGIFCHNVFHVAVFSNPGVANAVSRWTGVILIGCDLCLPHHAYHHAFPNIQGIDGAIEMNPLIRWVPCQARPLLFFQGLPLVLWFGVIIWLAYPIHIATGFVRMYNDGDWNAFLICIFRHMCWPLLGRHCYPLVGLAFCGWAWIAVAASLQHFAMVKSDSANNCLSRGENGNISFVRTQAPRIRDSESSVFEDWALGHLNLHIAHHLYPMLPPQNLHLIQKSIMKSLSESSIPFERTSTLRSLVLFCGALINPLDPELLLID